MRKEMHKSRGVTKMAEEENQELCEFAGEAAE